MFDLGGMKFSTVMYVTAIIILTVDLGTDKNMLQVIKINQLLVHVAKRMIPCNRAVEENREIWCTILCVPRLKSDCNELIDTTIIQKVSYECCQSETPVY